MRLKMTAPDGEEPTIAVERKGHWYRLNVLLEKKDERLTDNDNEILSDMVQFLARGEELFSRVEEIMASDDLPEDPGADSAAPCIPFQPASYRDFLLQDEHFINSSRGYVKRFLPHLYPVVKFYETVTGRVFPRLKPGKLWYRVPVYYMGNHLNIITTEENVAFPSYSRALDYELEMGVLVVRPLKNATPEEARKAIGGFVVFNDLSARDVQKEEMDGGLGPMKSKHFINAISDVVVTPDDIFPNINSLKGEVIINDHVAAQVDSSGMKYSIEEALAYASLEEQIYPGEFIATGTWTGGCALENENWVEPGDRLELRIDRIGNLVTYII